MFPYSVFPVEFFTAILFTRTKSFKFIHDLHEVFAYKNPCFLNNWDGGVNEFFKGISTSL